MKDPNKYRDEQNLGKLVQHISTEFFNFYEKRTNLLSKGQTKYNPVKANLTDLERTNTKLKKNMANANPQNLHFVVEYFTYNHKKSLHLIHFTFYA